jgi:hypothetical protein
MITVHFKLIYWRRRITRITISNCSHVVCNGMTTVLVTDFIGHAILEIGNDENDSGNRKTSDL